MKGTHRARDGIAAPVLVTWATIRAEPLLCVEQGFQAVLSDMCPATIGHQLLDVHRSLDLAHTACALALGSGYDSAAVGPGVLQPCGNLLMKLLQVCRF